VGLYSTFDLYRILFYSGFCLDRFLYMLGFVILFFLKVDTVDICSCIKFSGGRCGRDHMVFGYTTTYAISTYHHSSCEFKPVHGEVYSIQHYVRTSLSVTSNRSVVFSRYSGFLHQLKILPWYNWNIVESGVKQHKPN